MFATTSFDLSLDSKIFNVLNEKFNADKIAINNFINKSLKNLLKTFNKVKVSKTKKEEGLSFDDLNEETQKAIMICANPNRTEITIYSVEQYKELSESGELEKYDLVGFANDEVYEQISELKC
ncbi:MAG: hypothetical protein Ta2D_10010 [Rickettsiales bacterium]|nr:MAG: hypothetical protein Ta2D_10010 [Rickettsiales bacterium]